jgi:hypothetical protein
VKEFYAQMGGYCYINVRVWTVFVWLGKETVGLREMCILYVYLVHNFYIVERFKEIGEVHIE